MRQIERINDLRSPLGYRTLNGDIISVKGDVKAQELHLWVNGHVATLTFEEVEALRSGLREEEGTK